MRLSILPLLSLLGAALGQCPSSGVSGFASVGSGTTGGGNGKRVTVTNANDLKNAAKASGQAVIVIQGTIRTGGAVSVSSDKTIMGADKDATIQGGFTMDRVSNVIIKNLNIQYVSGGPADTLASKYSHHIWYDHLNVWDASDGLIDITRESDYQTVSWCKFWYSNSGLPHRLASLVGGGGGSISHMNDEGKLHVTYHHNYWAQNVDQRMPRIMYGEGHVYNNYFNSPGNSYCIGFGSYASVNIENNYFDGVKNPHQFMYDVYAYAQGSGNVYDGTSGKKDLGNLGSRHADGHSAATHNSNPFTPPYSFSLDSASSIPDVVKRCAGSGGASSDDSGNDDDNDGGNDDEDDDGDNDDDDDGNSGGCADMWGQCGGSGYTGPTCCSSGTCTRSNEWYSQCL